MLGSIFPATVSVFVQLTTTCYDAVSASLGHIAVSCLIWIVSERVKGRLSSGQKVDPAIKQFDNLKPKPHQQAEDHDIQSQPFGNFQACSDRADVKMGYGLPPPSKIYIQKSLTTVLVLLRPLATLPPTMRNTGFEYRPHPMKC